MAVEKLLTVKNLSVSYGGSQAIDNVSFDVNGDEIVGIVGESGSGKTTLLRSIISLLDKNGRITGGSVTFDGTDMVSLSEKTRSKIAGKEISMIFQNSERSLDAVKTIGSQMVECIRTHQKMRRSDAETLGKEVLSCFGFEDIGQVWKSYPFALSGGMCQRAAIAMAIVNQPRLLLADEPTGSLDVTVQNQTVKTLVSLRGELHTSILIVTHNMGVVAHMADLVGVMYKGRMVEWGRRDEVLFEPKHPYTVSLLSAVPGFDKEFADVVLFDNEKYRIENHKIYYSDTHWSLETERYE